MSHKIWLVIISLMFLIFSLVSAWQESLTFDEIVDIEEGRNILVEQKFAAVDPYNPPFLKELTFWPLALGLQKFIPSSLPNHQSLPGRLVPVFLTICLVWLVHGFVSRQISQEAGLWAALLFMFEPTFLGHSHYITYDTAFALIFFLAFIFCIKYLHKTDWKWYLLSSVSVGLGLASRISAGPFLAVSLLPLLIIGLRDDWVLAFSWMRRMVLWVIFVGLVIWSSYFFQWGLVIPPGIGGQERVSQKILNYANSHENKFLAESIKFLETQPLPLGHYLALIKSNLLRGINPGRFYFRGEEIQKTDWWMPAAALLWKLPIPLWGLFITGTIILIKTNINSFVQIGLPAFSMTLAAGLLGFLPLVRLLTPAIIFIVMTAAVGIWWLNRRPFGRWLIIILLIWYVRSVMSHFPHYITYANNLAGPRERRFMKLMDSNLDWGQGLVSLRKYSLTRPGATINLSYFGRDDAAAYGFVNSIIWGSYKENEICQFHQINDSTNDKPATTIISVSNWYYCGYFRKTEFSAEKVKEVVADSFLVF